MIKQFCFILCAISLLTACRKKIDFTVEPETSSFGPNNPNLDILKEWEEVVPKNAYSTLSYIETNGEDLLFVGYKTGNGWQINKLDTNGVVATILTNSAAPTVLTYNAPLFYTAYQGVNTNTINGFDLSGVQYSLDFTLGAGKSIFKILKDADTLHLFGNFLSSGANAVPNSHQVCSLNSISGVPLAPKEPLFGTVFDAQMVNGQLCISGIGLGATSNLVGAMARWNGTQWSSFNYKFVQTGPYINTDYYALIYSFAQFGNNDIMVGGRLESYRSSVAISQIGSSTNSFFPEFIGTTDWLSSKVMVKRSQGYVLAYNQVKFNNSSFTSVYVYDGSWKSIGALDGQATDVVVHQGYVYAISGGSIKRYPVE